MFTLPKKRMTIFEIIPAIFSCWKSLVVPLLPLSILAVLLTAIPTLGIKLGLLKQGHVVLLVIAYAISYAIYLLPSGAIIARISYALHEKKITTIEALHISASRFLKMLLTGTILLVLMFLLIRIGMLFSHIRPMLGLGVAFILIISVSPYLIPASPLVIIENRWPHTAIVGGFRLVNHNWLSVFITMLVVSLVTLLLNYLAGRLGVVAVYLVTMVTLPLTLSMTVIITENLKLGKA